jgi:hypothetical protein
MLLIVNMTPASLGAEANQDGGLWLEVDFDNTYNLTVGAQTPAPLGESGDWIYVSDDGGESWTLRPRPTEQDGVADAAAAGGSAVRASPADRDAAAAIQALDRGRIGAVRAAAHADGTVYAVFRRRTGGAFPKFDTDILVVRDDPETGRDKPFRQLLDPRDNLPGRVVAAGRTVSLTATMGQERLGAGLAIAVDPAKSGAVWIATCDHAADDPGGAWTLRLFHSTDRGQTWSVEPRSVANARGPALAVSAEGTTGLLYQHFTGARWETRLEVFKDAWTSATRPLVLHSAPAHTPTAEFLPFLGDPQLVGVGAGFLGVFGGANTPDVANFPHGVAYQRGADWENHTLLAGDGVTVIPPSIDPFFFRHWGAQPARGPGAQFRGPSPGRGPISRGPVSRGPGGRGPGSGDLPRGPIFRGPGPPPAPEAPLSAPPDTPEPRRGEGQDLKL